MKHYNSMKEDNREENIPKKEVLKNIISILKKIFTCNYYKKLKIFENKLNIQEQYIQNIGVNLEKIFEQQNIQNIQNLQELSLENKLNIQEQQNILNIQNLENKLNNNIFLSAILKNGFFYIQIHNLEYKKQDDFFNNYDSGSSVIINSEQFILIKILHVNNIDYNMNIELISKLTNLQSLYLYDSYNYSLIVDLEPLQQIISLNLFSCRFQVIFSNLKNLQSLYIDCNKYSHPDETISSLENLKILTISNFKKYHNIDLSPLQNLQYLTLNNVEFNNEVQFQSGPLTGTITSARADEIRVGGTSESLKEDLNLDLSSLQNLKVLNLCYNVFNNGVQFQSGAPRMDPLLSIPISFSGDACSTDLSSTGLLPKGADTGIALGIATEPLLSIPKGEDKSVEQASPLKEIREGGTRETKEDDSPVLSELRSPLDYRMSHFVTEPLLSIPKGADEIRGETKSCPISSLKEALNLDISSLQNLQILNDYFNSGFIKMTGLKLKYYYKDDNLVLDE